MVNQTSLAPIYISWSEYEAASDAQDPLGLGLRGSTRLANRLLYCITSITPRARYFSFIPWCVLDWQQHEQGRGFALGLREAIVVRENALTLGCVAHHDGNPCKGGALVGSDEAKKWFLKGAEEADLRRLKLAKNPALGAYYNSLVNLGVFEVDEYETSDSDSEEEQVELGFDDIKLSKNGQLLAQKYNELVGRLESVRNISTPGRRVSLSSLKQLGDRGGLCELSEAGASDRQVLIELFFAQTAMEGESHQVRKQSLLLILELCKQLSKDDWGLHESSFRHAIYYGELVSDDGEVTKISWPTPLRDIATRWRMFYFHHYMSVALEGMFSWLVTNVSQEGLSGISVEELVSRLDSAAVSKSVANILGTKINGQFGNHTPKNILVQYADNDVLNATSSKRIDAALKPSSAPFVEEELELIIRAQEELQSPTGLAIPLILLTTTLARYTQWEETIYGNWMANASIDPHLDLLPPVLITDLTRRFGQWWDHSWPELAEFLLSRYVVQQHLSMAYEKTAAGDRCILQVDGRNIISNAAYEKIGMGNPRFGSAVQILEDLGLLAKRDDGVTILTEEGNTLLKSELAKM